jgi:hypothetical protein
MSSQNGRNNSPTETIGSAFDRVSSLFQVDTLATQQFHDTYRRKIPQQPEIRLMLAVLEDAINCYQDNLLKKSASSFSKRLNNGLWMTTRAGSFPLYRYARFSTWNPTISGSASDGGRRAKELPGRRSPGLLFSWEFF